MTTAYHMLHFVVMYSFFFFDGLCFGFGIFRHFDASGILLIRHSIFWYLYYFDVDILYQYLIPCYCMLSINICFPLNFDMHVVTILKFRQFFVKDILILWRS